MRFEDAERAGLVQGYRQEAADEATAERMEQLHAWLERIHPVYADVIEGELVQGESTADMADRLGITTEGVAARRRRAIECMRYLRWLDETLGTDDEGEVLDMVREVGTPAAICATILAIWRTSSAIEAERVTGFNAARAWTTFARLAHANSRLSAWVKGHRWRALHHAPLSPPSPKLSLKPLADEALAVLARHPGLTSREIRITLGIPSKLWVRVRRRLLRRREVFVAERGFFLASVSRSPDGASSQQNTGQIQQLTQSKLSTPPDGTTHG
jgi:hypothetical protein